MAPSHVDLSVLWVPIMPETSKLGEQMEKVGQDATESFGKGTTGLGDKIHDSITKSKDKLKDAFKRTGTDASDSIADGVKESSKKVEDAVEDAGNKAKGKFRDSLKDVGKEFVNSISPDVKRQLTDRVEDVVGGAFKSVLGDNGVGGIIGDTVSKAASQGVGSWLDGLKDKVGGVKAAADNTRKAFADFGSGDTAGGVSKLVDTVGKLGIEVKDLPQPLQDAVGKINEAKSTTQQWSDIFKDMPGKVGLIGSALTELAGPLAVALQASKDIDAQMRQAGIDPNAKGDANKTQIEDNLHRIHRDGNGNIVVGPKAPKPPGVDMGGVGGIGTGGDVLGSSADAYDIFSSGQPLAAPSAAITPRDVGSDKGLTSTSENLKKTVSTLFPQINDIGGWRPPDGYNEHSSGQALDVMIPNSNTPQGKALGDQIKNYVLGHAKELGVDYALWQQNQWNPDGSHSGMENRGGATQNHMDHVHIHTVRGGGDGTMPTDMPAGASTGAANYGPMPAGTKGPVGTEHDPLYVTHSASSGSGGGSSSEDQGQQLGSGMVNGVLQEFGLDGSVFKTFGGSSNPLKFGITKLATGMVNAFGGAGGGDGAAMSFGGGGGIPGMGMLQSLIPGAAVSHGVVPTGPGGAQNVRTPEASGDVHYHGPVGPQLNVTQNGVQSPTDDLHAFANGASNRLPAMGNTANAGNLPSP